MKTQKLDSLYLDAVPLLSWQQKVFKKMAKTYQRIDCTMWVNDKQSVTNFDNYF